MKQTAVRILLLLNAALAAVLVLQWFHRDGSVRNTHWTPPQPLPPPLKGEAAAALDAHPSGDMRSFLATLDRPLFSSTRRPPPPPTAAASAPAPPPDPLANVRLFGVFQSEGGGGMIAQIDGKNTVVRVRESVGPWVVQSINDRTVTLVRGAQTRVLRLAALTALPPSDAPPPRASTRTPPARARGR